MRREAEPPRRAFSRASSARRRWLLRGLAAALLAVTFGYVPYLLYARSGFASYLRLRQELRVLQQQNARLRLENERLARDADSLRGDLRTIERVARTELRWVRPGEVVFDLGGAPR